MGLIAILHLFPPQLQAPIEITTIGYADVIALLIPTLMARRPRDWLMTRALRLAPGRLRPALERWRDQFVGLDIRPALMGKLLLATICSATSTMVRLWLLFLALNLSNVPIPALVSSMALISILQALPISFSGVGVRDAVLIAVLASYGYGPDKALSLSALFLLVNIEHLLIGFFVSLRHPLGSTPRAEGQQESARPRAENQSTINQ